MSHRAQPALSFFFPELYYYSNQSASLFCFNIKSKHADLDMNNLNRVGVGKSFLCLPPFISVDDFSEESSFYEILPCCARFRCGELIIEGQWHHLVLVMSKGMLKNSTAALYIDGQLVNTVKVSVCALVNLPAL